MTPVHTKAAHKIRRFAEVDVELEEALSRIRVCAQALSRGRVTCVIERLEGVTVGHRVNVDGSIEDDLERVMRERPRRRRG